MGMNLNLHASDRVAEWTVHPYTDFVTLEVECSGDHGAERVTVFCNPEQLADLAETLHDEHIVHDVLVERARAAMRNGKAITPAERVAWVSDHDADDEPAVPLAHHSTRDADDV